MNKGLRGRICLSVQAKDSPQHKELKEVIYSSIIEQRAGEDNTVNTIHVRQKKEKEKKKLFHVLDEGATGSRTQQKGDQYQCPSSRGPGYTYICTFDFKGKPTPCLIDTGSVLTLLDEEYSDEQGWDRTKEEVELCYASKGASAIAGGYLKKDGCLSGGVTDIRIRPVVVKLASKEYKMIIGNKDLMRMGICLRGLPSPTFLRSKDERMEEELIERMTGLDTKKVFELTTQLEEMLERNPVVTMRETCTLPSATVHLNLSDEGVRNVKSGKRNFVAQEYEQAVTETVTEWLKEGTISKLIGKTPVNLSLLAVKQMDSGGVVRKIRVCLDLRPLNAVLTMDNTVLPTIDELLHRVAGHKIYTTLDLKSGYHQLPVATKDRRFLAFTWKGTTYQFNMSPFGINFLPAKFHKLIAAMFADLVGVAVYLDDICIFAMSEEEHNRVLEIVLKRLEDARLTLNLKKCEFAKSSIKFLGYKVSEAGIEVDLERQQRLLQTPIPTTGSKLRRFLATVSFIRQHLPYFGEAVADLYSFQQHKGSLDKVEGWLEKGPKLIQTCMDMIHTPMVLKSPVPGLKFHLETDASEYGWGGSLFQFDPITGRKRYIEFFSGSFKGASRSHSIPRKEMAALMKGLLHCKYYLLGRRFTVWTDNMALTHLQTMAPDSAVLDRWFGTLSQFDFDINHVPGKENTLPDLLSRMYDEEDGLSLDEDKDSSGTGFEVLAMASGAVTGSTNDWQLVNEYVMAAASRWGAFTVDAFASKLNKQCSLFIDKELDFFAVEDLEHEKLWMNPPFKLIAPTLERVRRKGWSAVIVVPYWPDAIWFPLWKSMLLDLPIVVWDTEHVFRRFGTESVGRTPWSKTIIAHVGSGQTVALPDDWIQSCKYNSAVWPGQKRICNVATVSLRRSQRLVGKREVKNLETKEVGKRSEEYKDDSWDQVAHGFAGDITHEGNDLATGMIVERELTKGEKLEIVDEYHRYTHANQKDLASMLRNIGGYDWNDVSEMVRKVDQRCLDCELHKPDRTGFHPLKSLTSEHPGDVWTVDLMFFDKHQSAETKTCVLHVIDNASSFSILRVLPNKVAVTVADALNSIMFEHGQPRMILYDGGGEFKTLFRDIFIHTRVIAGIQGLPYRPQSQGQNERKHSKIKQLIRMALHKFGHDWAEVVPMVMAQVNDTWTVRHKSTPFAIYFGRASHALASNAPLSRLHWHERLALFQAAVKPRLKRQLEAYSKSLARAFDKRHERDLADFKVGDLVKIKNMGHQTSASALFKGPFTILERVSGGYHVALVGSTVKVNVDVVPPEQLSKWRRMGVDVLAPIKGTTRLTEESYVWKSILDHKLLEDGTWYKVRWDSNEVTWEPASIFAENSLPVNLYYAGLRACGKL